MENVVALLVERETRSRTSDALREHATLSFCDTCSDFRALAWHERPGAVIVEPRDRHGVPVAPSLGELRVADPTVPMIAYLRPDRDSTHDIRTVVQAGITELVFHDAAESRFVLRSALGSAKTNCARARALSLVRTECPVAMRPVMEYCINQAEHRPSVEGVARALCVHRKTLADRLARAKCPSPATTISWSRLFLAAALLDDQRRSIDEVALELDYPSPTAFRNQLKRYVGVTASELRLRGALTWALSVFRSSVQTIPCGDEAALAHA